MKKHTIILFLISIVIFTGCTASKTTLAKVNKQNLSTHALIIGTFSRNLGTSYLGHNSFEIVDLNHKLVKSVFDNAKDNMSLGGNPYEYNNDFIYKDTQGSIFAVLIPEGNYYLHKFSAGKGSGKYVGKFNKKIDVKRDDVLYVGDFNFKPIREKLENHPFFKNKKVTVGATVTIKNSLNRDYAVLKKHLGNDFLKKDEIKLSVINEEFNLIKFTSDVNPMLFLPVIIY